MDFLPPGLFQGVGVVAVLMAILTSSWWLLMRGTIHTDTEFQFVLAQLAARDKQLEAKDAALTESLRQKAELIDANRTITHVLESFRAAVEAKR